MSPHSHWPDPSQGLEPLEALATIDEESIKREKQKGRLLRTTSWWKQRCNQGVCYYCHQKFQSSELTMDHIVPLVRGGRSARGNVVPACKPCNSAKQSQLLMEWDQFNGPSRDD